ncbi:hypothetical protein C0Q70_01318, partial [Pomacea canaliculata]
MEQLKDMNQSVTDFTEDIHTILLRQNENTKKKYDTLLSLVANLETKPKIAMDYLKQLRGNVILLGKEHEKLVGTLMYFPWADQDEDVVTEYQAFLLNLVSAHPYYLRACIKMVIRHFFPAIAAETPNQSMSQNGYQFDAERSRDARFIRAHYLLQSLAKIVPSTRSILVPLLGDSFPFVTRDVFTHKSYTRNVLQVMQYLPDLRLQLLELIVDRMLRLDVRASRKDIEEAEFSINAEMDHVNFVCGEKVQQKCYQEITYSMKHEEAERLDTMMDLVLAHIYHTCYPSGQDDWEETKKLFRELLFVFDKLIFITHASNHTQFLLFYICSFKQPLCERFIEYLWGKTNASTTQTIFRKSAAGYIASFLTRASFLNISTVKSALELMMQWANKYLQQVGSESHADFTHHSPFYAVCQTIFYVFCVWGHQLFESHLGFRWIESLKFQDLVHSKLNPLRFCQPFICKTFASLMRMHQLTYCDTKIENNSRYSFGVVDEVLPAMYSFDPYLLKKSLKWIKPLYRGHNEILHYFEETDKE